MGTITNIGDTVTSRGQRFEATAIEPFRRVDGSDGELVVWASRCPVCDRAFKFTAPRGVDLVHPNRRCDLHKRPGRKAPKRPS